jgi:peptide/nickel transport system permease protein
MSYVRYIARRAAFAVLSVYAVVTVMFFLANYMWKYYLRNRLAFAEWSGASDAQLRRMRQQFVQQRGLDQPLHERYVDWLVSVATLDWGYSFEFQRPVIEVIRNPAITTLEYVVPGVILAVVLGVLLGLVAALTKDSAFDWATRVGAYVLFALPAFIVIDYFLHAALMTNGAEYSDRLARDHSQVIAAVTVAVSLLAGQVRFTRTASLDQTGQAFVKLLEAKGSSRIDVARHVLRNASLPIVSMSTSEIISVLALDIFVIERVLPIDGLASVMLLAVSRGDIPILIWSTMLFVFIGIAGNFVTDLLYGYLDPRVRAE